MVKTDAKFIKTMLKIHLIATNLVRQFPQIVSKYGDHEASATQVYQAES